MDFEPVSRTAEGLVSTQRVFDLSLPFTNDMPTYYFYKNVFQPPMFTLFSHPALGDARDGIVSHVSFLTHIGTHVDAPRHFRYDGQTINEIPVDRWFGMGIVLGIPKDPASDITAAELNAVGADVRSGDIVALNTGWHERFRGPAVDREGAIAYMETGPGLCAESARWLVQRGVKTVMIDTPALDSALHMPYGDGSLESHEILFAQNIPGIEGLGGELNAVTGRRCVFSCAPVNYVGGEAFPVRVLAVPVD